MRPGTTAPEPTTAPVRTTAPCSTIDPLPTRAPSSIVQPSRCTRWPITQSAPTIVGYRTVVCSTDPSWIDVRAPITMPPVVAPQHRARPDRRLGADRDVADDDGVGVHVGRRVDAGLDIPERVDRHRGTLSRCRREPTDDAVRRLPERGRHDRETDRRHPRRGAHLPPRPRRPRGPARSSSRRSTPALGDDALPPRLARQPGAAHRRRRRHRRAASPSRSSTGSCSPAPPSTTR